MPCRCGSPRRAQPTAGDRSTDGRFKRYCRAAIGAAIFLLSISGEPAPAQTNQTSQTDQPDDLSASSAQLKKLSLEQLLNLEVTSVSRRPEPWFTSPSAIQVVTGEDIHRSAATSIPEALRLAPNLEVAQVDSRSWAISARGFNNTLANKLLLMMDGRTLYTPLFAGVFWDVQDTMLEDIDRIEVVSGPGGTLWGANAVNGVINIITKSAQDTQGALVTAGGGTLLQDFVSVRYGDKIGEDLYFRVYGKYFDRNDTVLPDGSDGTNAWNMAQGGFRMDWLPKNGDTVTLQGDFYGGTFEQPAPGDTTANGQNVLARWTRPLGEGSALTVQTFWDRTWRDIPGSFAEELNTFDIDFQHQFMLGNRNSIIWGGGYRLMPDEIENTSPSGFEFLPPDRNLQLFSGFIQDEIAIIPERLNFTIGTKLEHNDYSGFEVQPSVRVAWTPDSRQTIWGAISRAVRSPSRVDRDLYLPGTNGNFVVAGGEDFDSEKVIAYELGYRVRPIDRVTLSLAGFYNNYTAIRSLSTNSMSNNALEFGNDNLAQEWGLEFSFSYQATDWWRLRGGYTFLDNDVTIKPGGSDLNQGRAEGDDPKNQFLIQSIMDLPYHIELDCILRYVDALPDPHVPAYTTADVRLAWRPKPGFEVSIVGQNLFDSQHPEFGAPATRQEIQRSVYGKITWSF